MFDESRVQSYSTVWSLWKERNSKNFKVIKRLIDKSARGDHLLSVQLDQIQIQARELELE
ncbi:hypothetical protein HanRHA438_Chr02g0058651 [Helianthus annuus]|nr:hypothetical protein HanRHA438_Chr02g0058651 [Helianthus annuus]